MPSWHTSGWNRCALNAERDMLFTNNSVPFLHIYIKRVSLILWENEFYINYPPFMILERAFCYLAKI